MKYKLDNARVKVTRQSKLSYRVVSDRPLLNHELDTLETFLKIPPRDRRTIRALTSRYIKLGKYVLETTYKEI
jgi:hypothetical protein